MYSKSDSPSSSETKETRKKRPILSCLPCFRRRVKCDHLMPCTPCCLRGTPTQCEFTEEGRSEYMLQSELIKNIIEACTNLESRLAELEKLGPTSR
ncbi:hypothetical protein BDV33DRAFT_226986 [Aspergillus novoparasiticus]|uniref:Zn(2)-C6 fungal-type domain-containing protein n=1 Tax=Aspergillus novoparasiticus TaxID=986946 RepID=A0A5N6FD50_9EURO|nr:hypothetical protein BDV33DRAFT_226986 [Aspergillus novoparasiticus]